MKKGIKTFNIKGDFPGKLEAGKRLSDIIRQNQKNQKIIKIVHGYGSTGVGGSIKISVHKSLNKRKRKGEIESFIPGEAFGNLAGYDCEIQKYKHILKNDSDYNKFNEGVTYIVFK